MSKVLKDFERRLAKVEALKKNKATTVKSVAVFHLLYLMMNGKLLLYPHQQQLVENTRN